MVDMVVARSEVKQTLARLIRVLGAQRQQTSATASPAPVEDITPATPANDLPPVNLDKAAE